MSSYALTGSMYRGTGGVTLPPDRATSTGLSFGSLLADSFPIAEAASFFLGTGSDVTHLVRQGTWKTLTGSSLSVVAHERAGDYIGTAVPTSDIVGSIRKAFGLSVTDLAAVLAVERPTVYSWLKDEAKPSLVRRQRLALVLRLADTWTATTGGGAIPDLDAFVSQGLSLRLALRSPAHWEREILACLIAQAEASQSKINAKRRLADLSKRPGIKSRDEDFDIATGRPLGPQD